MIVFDALPEVSTFVSQLHNELNSMPGKKPSMTVKVLSFLSFCITAIIVTGSLNWDRFERSSCGKWKAKALSWLMRHSRRIPWNYLLIASSRLIVRMFKIARCHLVFDDFDRDRSKRTKMIYGAHKVRNKKGGGFVSAQNIVLLVLVTPVITLPVFAWFYRPDPVQKAWRKEDVRLRKLKIRKKYRPKQPPLNSNYPGKKQIVATLLRKFKYYFGGIEVRSVSGDAVYLSSYMKAEIDKIFPSVQFISQLRCNQKVMLLQNKSCRLDEYFANKKPQEKVFELRGHLEKKILFLSARLFIKAHSKASHVVAFRYEGESKYRYICASKVTWRAEDIIRAYAFRWLVEVVIEDLKQFDGWGKDASQYGFKGASRGLSLSLLLDHFLLQHPKQLRLHQTGKSLNTTGSMRNQLQFESLIRSIKSIVESDDPKAKLKEISAAIDQLVVLRPSTKHMAGKTFDDPEPSPWLEKKFGKIA